jgi:hypothetical protein
METTATPNPIITTADGSLVCRVDNVEVYTTPSDSTEAIHTVIGSNGHWSCTGPHCKGRTCKHIRRVLEARAGF